MPRVSCKVEMGNLIFQDTTSTSHNIVLKIHILQQDYECFQYTTHKI